MVALSSSTQVLSSSNPLLTKDEAMATNQSQAIPSQPKQEPQNSSVTQDVFSSRLSTSQTPSPTSPTTAVLPVPIPVQIVPSHPPHPFWQKALETAALTGIIVLVLNPSLVSRAFDRLSGKKNPFDLSRFEMLKKSNTKLSDVIGADDAKEEIAKILDFIKNPKAYQAMGAKLPKGVLLSGPPGTGKTLLAKAIAGESELPMILANASEFDEKYVGVGAERVRALFKQARQVAEQEKKPVIIFMDELDAIGKSRNLDETKNSQTINQLLVEMDGLNGSEHQIIVIGATNAKKVLDSALLRPGRFGKQIEFNLPNLNERKALLEHCGAKVNLDDSVAKELASMAQKTYGMSPADIENIINEAAMLAARKGEAKISVKTLNEAYEQILMGAVKEGSAISDKDKEQIAIHEAGHAIVRRFLDPDSEIDSVTIAPRNKTLGFSFSLPKGEYEEVINSPKTLKNHIAVSLGGRVAETIVNGKDNVASGAMGDFRKAASLVQQMVYDLGMFSKDSKLAPMSYRELGDLSEAQRRELEQEMQKIVSEQYQKAEAILKKQRRLLEAVKDALMTHETLNGKDFQQLVADHQV